MLVSRFSLLLVLARIKKDTMQLYLIDVTLLLQLYTLIITIPLVVHKYTLICIASCSSLYIYRVPPLLVSKLILSDVILS